MDAVSSWGQQSVLHVRSFVCLTICIIYPCCTPCYLLWVVCDWIEKLLVSVLIPLPLFLSRRHIIMHHILPHHVLRASMLCIFALTVPRGFAARRGALLLSSPLSSKSISLAVPRPDSPPAAPATALFAEVRRRVTLSHVCLVVIATTSSVSQGIKSRVLRAEIGLVTSVCVAVWPCR